MPAAPAAVRQRGEVELRGHQGAERAWHGGDGRIQGGHGGGGRGEPWRWCGATRSTAGDLAEEDVRPWQGARARQQQRED